MGNGVNFKQVNDVLSMQENNAVLSIDVEDYDNKVLKSIDFKRHHPFIICVEVGKSKQELVEFMDSNGYRLVFCNYINCIWIRCLLRYVE